MDVFLENSLAVKRKKKKGKSRLLFASLLLLYKQAFRAKSPVGFYFTRFVIFFFSLCSLLGPSAQGQSSGDTLKNKYKLLFELKLEASHFTTDKLQNIYYISQANEVVKLGPDGSEQFRFINKTLGTPTYLDATNPFNLLLFYPDYQTVLTLDRTMNQAGQFNLFDLGLFGLGAVGMAGDGHLWLYDMLNFRLKKVGREGQLIVQSADLSLELNRSVSPNFILERNQQVYVNDPALGILVFDVFGKYLKTIPILALEEFQVVGDQLLFCQNGQMHSFHLVTLLQNPVWLPSEVTADDHVQVQKDRLYVLGQGLLKIYQL